MKTLGKESQASTALLYALAYWGERTVCVWRQWEGKPAVLKLDNPASYKEWGGCFSLYNHANKG